VKELSFLLKHIGKYDIFGRSDRLISSIEFDSRKVKPGDDDSFPIYLAQRGTQVDGHLFINQAIDKGASTIICEKLPDEINLKSLT
jgi:UDP-N-acetylmuramoyl-L-alanyl-D-glutamate--2,6-diaminopimelate ligase